MNLDPRYKTAFFHELGHYVVHELNRTTTASEVTEIILKPHNTLSRIDGCLSHTYTNETMAQKLANNVHGCFFESVFLVKDFNICLCAHESGEVDMFDFNRELNNAGIDSYSDKREKLNELNARYFGDLKKSSTLKKILELCVQSYLTHHPTIPEAYLVNLEDLAADMASLLAEYKIVYTIYLNDIQAILDL